MKRLLVFIGVFFSILSAFPQQIQEESVVINVEIPVRVFRGNEFIDTLGIDDFEVFEDGIPQNVEAVYLVKKRNVERSEEKKRFTPNTSRNFYLYFEISEYTKKIGDAVDYFIQNIMYPDDYLIVLTPLKTYRLHGKALELKPRKEVAKQLIDLLRKDALVANTEYRHLLSDLEGIVRAISRTALGEETQEEGIDDASLTGISLLPIEQQLTMYRVAIDRIEKIRTVDQQNLYDFADILKDKAGQKYVFMFYQREYVPQIEQRVLNELMTQYQEQPTIQLDISQIFAFYRRDVVIDVEGIKQAFADSSIAIHFLFITEPMMHSPGVDFQEKSEDIYSAFKEMSRATGGFMDSSANAQFLFQKAVESSENYYLVYYSPTNYKSDGKFKEIRVRVKSGNYRISHRLGYYAN
jgi:hypothetical protein